MRRILKDGYVNGFEKKYSPASVFSYDIQSDDNGQLYFTKSANNVEGHGPYPIHVSFVSKLNIIENKDNKSKSWNYAFSGEKSEKDFWRDFKEFPYINLDTKVFARKFRNEKEYEVEAR